MTLKLKRATGRTQKRLKRAMVCSSDPHNTCAKVDRITEKTGCTSCKNWTISFKVQGFQTKTRLLLVQIGRVSCREIETFLVQAGNVHRKRLKFQPFLTLFAIFHAFNDLFSAK